MTPPQSGLARAPSRGKSVRVSQLAGMPCHPWDNQEQVVYHLDRREEENAQAPFLHASW
jgi:hypothetical protein